MKKSEIKNRKSRKEYLEILRQVDADENAFFGSREPDGWQELERNVYAFIGEFMSTIHLADFFYSDSQEESFFSFSQFVEKKSSLEKNERIKKIAPVAQLDEGEFELEATEVMFSNYGQLVVVYGEKYFDERSRDMLEKILEKYGFVWVPNEIMMLDYDGVDEDYGPESEIFKGDADFKPTWLYRFFHV